MSTGYIPQEILDEIASKCDIVSVVNEYVPLKRKGANYQGLCPFHSEKTPSFSVSPSKQIYHCFGCGAGGNVFKFMMEIDHLTFPEAVEKLSKRAGVSLPEKELTTSEKILLKRNERLIKINELTAKFYQKVLMETKWGKPYLDYLQRRGMSQVVIEKFGLGACQIGWDGLYKFLLSRQVSPEEMIQLGLVMPRKEGNGCYDRFRQRIMFPICNDRGQVVAFGGRIIDAEVSAQKYMNSPDTPLFHKGRMLYGLDVAKNSIRQKDAAVIVEGYMDVISCHQYGITNAIAPLGTAFTPDQAKLLMRNTYQIQVAFDGDTAGSKATWRSLDILSELGCQVKVVNLPEGLDPDEFLKKNGQQAFEQLISESQELIVYKIDRLMENINVEGITGKMNVVEEILPDLLKLQSPVARESAIKVISDKLQVTETAIWSELKHYNKKQQVMPKRQSQGQEEPTAQAPINQTALRREGQIIKILFEHQPLLALVEEAGGSKLFGAELGRLYDRLLVGYTHQQTVKSTDFSEEDTQLLSNVLMTADVSGDAEKTLVDYIRHLQQEKLDHEYQMRLQELADAEKTGATEKMLKALQELEVVRAKKKEIEITGKGE